MTKLVLSANRRDKGAVESLWNDVARRIVYDPISACPVDLASSFVGLAHSQSCGKCTPCRIGLSQLSQMLEAVLDGKANDKTPDMLLKLSRVIMATADCAIGYTAAQIVYNAVKAFGDDFESHIKYGHCGSDFETPVPCVGYCPAHVDIPGYIALVGGGNYKDAVRLIRKDNPFPSACALICEHPCEHYCRRGLVDDSVNIRGLKRMAVDNAGVVPVPERLEGTGKRVAVIGGGPSGLSCAYYLSLMGHEVTVYDKRKQLGGMLRYGIPSYRLPREILDEEIRSILSAGITVHTDTEIGKDITFEEIKANNDAVYISIGAHSDNKLGIEGEGSRGVMSAVQMLRGIGDGEMPDFKGKRVIVVGGGNVAMDCTRSSVRLGASSVICAYRRRKEDMTALPEEIEGAVEEGAVISTLVAPEKIEADENGNVKALWVKPQMITKVSRNRPGVTDAECDSIRLEADIIVVAIGQKIESEYFESKGIPAKWGRIIAGEDCKVTQQDGVFSGGDCVTGPATAIKAIAAGKVASRSIDSFLGFNSELSVNVEIPVPKYEVYPPCGRINLSERPAGERKNDFALMEKQMTAQECNQESQRCLRCDSFGYGRFRGGRVWKW